jgi:hypothetical protein
MATNTTLQYLESTGEDAFGASASLGANVSNRRQVETFIASAAIAAGDAVAFDLSQTDDNLRSLRVLKADTGATTSKCFVGIALNPAAAEGDRVNVCLAGPCVANIGSGGGVGVPMMISTNGELVDFDGPGDTVQTRAAHCATTVADGQATVIVHKQF